MTKIAKIILLSLCALLGVSYASAASGDLFVYPTPPDTMQHIQHRCDYIVSRFWDRCNFGQAFTKPDKLNAAFGDWMAVIPLAYADTVHVAIDALLKRFEKKGPETLALAEIAENWLYTDTAQYASTELYLPFAHAAANHKKISKAERARFAAQEKLILSSSVGATVPAVPLVYADGSKGTLDDIRGNGSVLLFFNDPDCMDCTLARTRLSADPNTSQLIDRGELQVVSIYAGDTDDQGWQRAKASADPRWMVVAMPQADDYFDLRTPPTFFFLNNHHRVLASQLDIEYLLAAFYTANQANKARQNGK